MSIQKVLVVELASCTSLATVWTLDVGVCAGEWVFCVGVCVCVLGVLLFFVKFPLANGSSC